MTNLKEKLQTLKKGFFFFAFYFGVISKTFIYLKKTQITFYLMGISKTFIYLKNTTKTQGSAQLP